MDPSSIDSHFLKQGAGRSRVIRCSSCEHIVASNKSRWVSHLRNCLSVSREIKLLFPVPSLGDRKRTIVHVNVGNDSLLPQSPEELAVPTQRPQQQQKMTQYLDVITAKEKDMLDASMAQVFYDTGIPFRVADSSSWKRHHQLLRPSYNPPSSKRIAGSLLKQAAAFDKQSSLHHIQNSEFISITTDGFSNLNRNHLVNFVIQFSNRRIQPAAWKILSTDDTYQTGENIALLIIDVLSEIGIDKIASVVTDNAANMRSAWNIIESNFPHIVCNGCAAHTMNLLVKDICQMTKYHDVIQKSGVRTAFVRNRNHIIHRFRIIQSQLVAEKELESAHELVFVVETRWYTHHNAVMRNVENRLVHESLLINQVFRRLMGSKQNCKKTEYSTIVKDELYWKNAEEFLSIVGPTTKLIGKLESNHCLLNEVYAGFLELFELWKSNDELKQLLISRWEFLHTPTMGFAYFLDPKNKGGRGMYISPPLECTNDLCEVLEMLPKFIVTSRRICSNVEIVKQEIMEYQKFAAYPTPQKSALINDMELEIWWAVIGFSHFPNLANAARILFTIPTSQAASERLWSIYDFIHSKRRNRLSLEKSTALTILYANAKIRSNEANIVSLMTGELSDYESDAYDSEEETKA